MVIWQCDGIKHAAELVDGTTRSYVRHDRTNVGRYLTKEKPMSRATTQNHANDVERAPVGTRLR